MTNLKHILSIALLLNLYSLILGQSDDYISFYNNEWQLTENFRRVTYVKQVQTWNDSTYRIKIYNRKGKLLMIGHFSNINTLIPNGEFAFFNISEEYDECCGHYIDGKISGKWKIQLSDTIVFIDYDLLPAEQSCENPFRDVFITYEDYPSFRGMDPAISFREYIEEQKFFPPFEELFSYYGRVIVQFEINEHGDLCNPRIARSINGNLDKEAIRILAMSPKWKGCKGRCESFTFPVSFEKD